MVTKNILKWKRLVNIAAIKIKNMASEKKKRKLKNSYCEEWKFNCNGEFFNPLN